MKKEENNDLYEIVNGNIVLNSPEYVFIYQDGKFKIKAKENVDYFDTVIMCSDCNTLPAIVLDRSYKKGLHDFTLCVSCLADFLNMGKKGKEDA